MVELSAHHHTVLELHNEEHGSCIVESETNQKGQEDAPDYGCFTVQPLEWDAIVLEEPEDLTLGVELDEPQKERDIIPRVEAVPNSAHHKDPQLSGSSSFEG